MQAPFWFQEVTELPHLSSPEKHAGSEARLYVTASKSPNSSILRKKITKEGAPNSQKHQLPITLLPL